MSDQSVKPTTVHSMHIYEVRPRKDKRGIDLIPMRSRSVVCGTANQMRSAMQSDMQRIAAGHMML